MKKIIILLTSILLLGGCYDNIELNQLYIVTGIGIDYHDDYYYVTYEILNSNKEGDSVSTGNLVVSGRGKTINNAFFDVNRLVNKKPFFSHLKTVVLKDTIEKKHLKEVVEFLIRKNDVRDEFNLVYTDSDIEELFTNTNDTIKVVSLEINELLNNGNNTINPAINEPFENTLSKIISKKQDIILNNIIIEDKTTKINGSYIFNNYNIVDKINNDEAYIYLLLNNEARSSSFNTKYKDGFLGISVTDSKIDYSIKNNTIEVTGKINALLTNNTSDLDLTKYKSLRKINSRFKHILEKDIEDFIKKLQNNESDILGLTKKYYKQTKIDDKNLWKYLDISINIDLTVNRKGLIFGVDDEK